MSWQPGWRTVRTVVVALPLALASIGIGIDYVSVREQIDARVSSTASAIAAYLESTLNQAATANDLVARFLDRQDGLDDHELLAQAAYLARKSVEVNDSVSAIQISDRSGQSLVEYHAADNGRPAAISPDLFARHEEISTSPNYIIGRPYIGERSNKRQFSISLDVRDREATVKYIVASTVTSSDLFENLLQASPYRDFTITLLQQDGYVLARHPSIGNNLTPIGEARMARFMDFAAGSGGSIFVGHLQFSPRLRLIDARQASSFPVYMAYSVAYWEALGPWLRRSLIVGLSAMAASAILFLALGQLMTATAHEIETERSLREAIDRERRAEIIALRNQDREIIARMAGGVGHEFNNLMGGVLGIGEALSTGSAASEKLPHFGQSLIDAADRGGTLAHALMIYAGSGFLDFKVVDLGDCVRSAVEAFRTTVGRGTEIHLRMPEGPINTRVDPEKLAIALGHLLMNSLEALPDSQGRIDVDVTVTDDPPTGVTGSSRAAQRFACISIIDNGIGMDADVLARARDPFFTTREIGQGTGLGLSMVDGLILASDGRIEIESQPGKGTQVTMWLPLNERAPDPSDLEHMTLS